MFLLTFFLAVATLLAWWLQRRHFARRRANEAVYVQGWLPFLGVVLDYSRDPVRLLRDAAASDGDASVVCLNIIGQRLNVLLDAADDRVLLRNEKVLDFSQFVLPLALAFGGTAAGVDRMRADGFTDEFYKFFTRGLLAKEELNKLTSRFTCALDQWLESAQVERGQVVDLRDFLGEIIWQCGSDALLGSGWTQANPRALERMGRFDEALPMLLTEIPPWLISRTLATDRQMLRDATLHRPPGVGEMCTLMSSRTKFMRERGFSEQDLGAMHLSILWGAFANTRTTFVWLCAHLLADPAALEAVRSELRSADLLDPTRPLADVTPDELKPGPALRSAIEETLRMYDWSMVSRQAMQDCELAIADEKRSPLHLRAGDLIGMYTMWFNRSEQRFDEPNRWRFDRFLTADGQLDNAAMRRVFHPFGAGSTQCPGRYYAIHEITLSLIAVLRRFDSRIELTADSKELPSPVQNRHGLGLVHPSAPILARFI